MFSKLAILIVSIAAVVAAVPTDPPAGGSTTTTTTINKCNVGTLQCCKSVQAPKDQAQLNQLGLGTLGVGNIEGMIGVECNPISGFIGAGTGSNCNATPACCKGNKINGVFAGGCGSLNGNL
ncbi:fungal hydrophobin [Macrolepiota fuliginosa MF-IS2]|uniref:Hydrophobin n=1 Tax=Macrolepiota fuliginosa MF-IS2 TaxID=1400762 RepID=A0A9P5X6M1_9AGAR|nr:fungal hydrophobin [Macrolepiota fuliginosa MF-IS2]